MSEIRLETRDTPEATVVAFRGDAGAANVSALEKQLQQLATKRPKLWVFDLAGLTFISSVGLVALVAFQKNARRAGGKVRIAAAPEPIEDILRASRLSAAFDLRPSVEDALAD